jgi:hypothetical protein
MQTWPSRGYETTSSARRKALQERRRREKVQAALDFAEKLLKGARGGTTNIVGGVVTVGDTNINTGQAGAIGRGIHVHNMTFNQRWNQSGESIDLPALATELATLRQHLRQAAVKLDHDVAIGAVAEAEMAAKEENGPKALECLSKAGKWALENAEKIGVGIATAALKTALGI